MGEPLATAALRYRVCDVDQCHRVLADMQGLDHGVGGGIDHVDFVGVLKADVDASVVGARPHAVRPIAVILDSCDQARSGAAAVAVDEGLVETADCDIRKLPAAGLGDELRVVGAGDRSSRS